MDENVKQKFTTYPDNIAVLLHDIRNLIFGVAAQDGITELEETLKWGEPSYISKSGSTIRFDYKDKAPQQFCIYFNCNTKLVETFKELYGDTFVYQGNRALVFELDQALPNKELAHCISLALRYKKIKHLPMLGA
ncbi:MULTISPECIES: DUF1801 domain-containing protein [unclassified Pseudoalteromonas]|uniref:DUF1801 domain-containing protein n=1 Tax=unclassified Pseudoalteromonas TaxID=194690 RepID=UPI000C084045|nr:MULTISPECIES: DUF1801 domain-containing protein [unclassified Pseudoalteromonas]MDP2635604.1 DUF1801 domain-containing protein [Pseudoalteromonas sp. 1_MG-2023]PHN88901.1 hypothetical protein CSC79_15540 [Pseudoalteromonas sp. 3D05]TGE85272.1 DUF1801 domain-containing protein [Pseudoalteromonas sp. KS88]